MFDFTGIFGLARYEARLLRRTWKFWILVVLGFLGATLGILFMIPLRQFLIVKEHEVLPYPEGTAAAEVLMAADAGLVRTDEDVISIGGTGRGADTALVLQPNNSFNIFDLRVKEVICKPSTF